MFQKKILSRSTKKSSGLAPHTTSSGSHAQVASGNWSRTNYRAHYLRSMGGSDPAHYIWAALSPKMAGRSRPHRGFRPRPILTLRLANPVGVAGLAHVESRTQGPHFVQNTSCNLAFCFVAAESTQFVGVNRRALFWGERFVCSCVHPYTPDHELSTHRVKTTALFRGETAGRPRFHARACLNSAWYSLAIAHLKSGGRHAVVDKQEQPPLRHATPSAGTFRHFNPRNSAPLEIGCSNQANDTVEYRNDGQTVPAVSKTFWDRSGVSTGISRPRFRSEIAITNTCVVGRPTDEGRASNGHCLRR